MTEWFLGCPGYRRGIQLFNDGHFFDAHEVLEDVWRAAPVPEKRFLQGLIQVAVAFHHHSTGNLEGTRSLLQRAGRNLSSYPEDFGRIGLADLLHQIQKWRLALVDGKPTPSLPRLEMNEC